MDRIAYIKIQKQDAFATDLKGWLIITTKKKKKNKKSLYKKDLYKVPNVKNTENVKNTNDTQMKKIYNFIKKIFLLIKLTKIRNWHNLTLWGVGGEGERKLGVPFRRHLRE